MRAFLKLELKWFQKKGDTGTGRILIQNFNLTYRNQPSMATICTSSLYLLQKLSCVTTQQTPLHYSNLEINKERKGGKKWKKKKHDGLAKKRCQSTIQWTSITPLPIADCCGRKSQGRWRKAYLFTEWWIQPDKGIPWKPEVLKSQYDNQLKRIFFERKRKRKKLLIWIKSEKESLFTWYQL